VKAVLAKYKSPCGLCESLIWPDDEIVEVEGDWCHLDCAEVAEQEEAQG
jgi:hypothetical protein